MSLKKQLIILFSALAFIALVVIGVTFWTFWQWQQTSQDTRVHFTRNLLLEQIRVATYQAFKEVPDAATGDDPDSRKEFIVFLEPAEKYFKFWETLPSSPEEQAERKSVRLAYDSLVQAAHYAFDLVEAGKKQEAANFMEKNLEDRNFAHFQKITDKATATDRQKNALVQEQVQKAQTNAQIILIIASLGAVSLILLLAAYLSADLFKPLREVEIALNNARNNLNTRFEEVRNDEIGRIISAFNRLMDKIEQREKFLKNSLPDAGSVSNHNSEKPAAAKVLNLRNLSGQLNALVVSLLNNPEKLNAAPVKIELLKKAEEISFAIEQVAVKGFSKDLALTKTDIRNLINKVLARFLNDLSRRAIHLELDINPQLEYALADKWKLRQALEILLQNALSALPDSGGKLGIRARLSEDKSTLWIEIADRGNAPINSAVETDKFATPNFKLAKDFIEQQGGRLKSFHIPDKGNYCRVELPFFQADQLNQTSGIPD